MDELEQVYLIAMFPDGATLKQAARALNLPANHMAVLGNEASAANVTAEELGVATELNEEIALDEGQDSRLEWHLENRDDPLLAVLVMAAQGRDVRLRLTELGGEMITAPTISSQESDVDYDPGMESDEPDLPPNHDRIYAPN